MSYSLLLVDDDPLIHMLVSEFLPADWTLISCYNLNIPFSMRYHAALVDIHLSADFEKSEGFDAMKRISERSPLTEIIAASGDLSREQMEASLRAGAEKFLAKPIAREEFLSVLGKIEAHWQLKDPYLSRRTGAVQILGNSNAIQKLRREISQFKREGGPLLIEGETGTGKELVAKALHSQEDSPRPYVQVNIASLPEHLFESEMFGHVRGAFTGADVAKIGLAQAANGGDLFLDEIEALPLHHQVKLLRFLDSGEIRRVGSTEVTRVQARVLVASNEKLSDLVDQKRFRQDLFFRLESKKIILPPLRDRRGDVEILAKTFLQTGDGGTPSKALAPDGLEEMERYSWPGNVRELKRVCDQLALVSPLPIIRREDVRKILLQPLDVVSASAATSYEGGLSFQIERFEATLIRSALRDLGHIDQVSQALQISRSHLYKKIKDYQIEL